MPGEELKLTGFSGYFLFLQASLPGKRQDLTPVYFMG
jgi:hypothetical protein